MQTRQLAAVLSRRFIHDHWSREKPWFQEPEVTQEHKVIMRRQLLQGLSVDDSKLCTAVSMGVASVAQHDFPLAWSELMPHLLGMLEAGTPPQVSAAMRCLVLVSEEMTEQQVPHIISGLFPALYQVFTSQDKFSKGIRSRACSVVLRAVKLASVSLLVADPADEGAQSCLQFLRRTLPSWIEVFAQELAAPFTDESEGELGIRIEIVKIFSVIVETHPQLLSASLAYVVHALWYVCELLPSTFISPVRNTYMALWQ